MENSLIPLLGMTVAELRQVAEECAMPRFAARQMLDWIYKKRINSIDDMTNLSKHSREVLSERYEIGVSPYVNAQVSRDGTSKYLFPHGVAALLRPYIFPRVKEQRCAYLHKLAAR